MAEARHQRERVVRPLAAAGGRSCARPGCPAPARATLSLVYADRVCVLEGLHADPSPATYDLCGPHADRTGPPHGWELRDDRGPDDLGPDRPRDLGGPDTVAVLAAAMHRDGPSADAPTSRVEQGERLVAAPQSVAAPVPAPRPVLAARVAPDPRPEASENPAAPSEAGVAPDVTGDGVVSEDDGLAALTAALAEIANEDPSPPRDTEAYLRDLEAIAEQAEDGDAEFELAASPQRVLDPPAGAGGARAQAW